MHSIRRPARSLPEALLLQGVWLNPRSAAAISVGEEVARRLVEQRARVTDGDAASLGSIHAHEALLGQIGRDVAIPHPTLRRAWRTSGKTKGRQGSSPASCAPRAGPVLACEVSPAASATTLDSHQAGRVSRSTAKPIPKCAATCWAALKGLSKASGKPGEAQSLVSVV